MTNRSFKSFETDDLAPLFAVACTGLVAGEPRLHEVEVDAPVWIKGDVAVAVGHEITRRPLADEGEAVGEGLVANAGGEVDLGFRYAGALVLRAALETN